MKSWINTHSHAFTRRVRLRLQLVPGSSYGGRHQRQRRQKCEKAAVTRRQITSWDPPVSQPVSTYLWQHTGHSLAGPVPMLGWLRFTVFDSCMLLICHIVHIFYKWCICFVQSIINIDQKRLKWLNLIWNSHMLLQKRHVSTLNDSKTCNVADIKSIHYDQQMFELIHFSSQLLQTAASCARSRSQCACSNLIASQLKQNVWSQLDRGLDEVFVEKKNTICTGKESRRETGEEGGTH